nr:fimbrial biogenesis outer membrane usher protein [Pseudomonas putida]
MLREGVWRYSATVGRYNGAEELDRPRFWEGTLARGGVWDSTLYGGVFTSDYYRAGALGVARDFADLGALSFDVTHANTDLGSLKGQVQGQSFTTRYGKSFATGTNLRFAGYRYSTEGYRDFVEAVRERNQSAHYLGNRRSRLEASVYQNVGNGSLSLTFSQDDYWGSTAQRRQYQVQYNTRWRDVSINLFASQALTDNTGDNRMFGLSLSLPLDFGRRHTASFDLQRYDGRYSERASLSGGMMNNQLGYQVSLSNDQQNNTSGALSLAHQGTNVSYGGGYTQGADYRSVSLNASGALLAHGSGIVLGPYMGETGALVHVPDVAGITLANTPSSQANRQGYLLASNLRPYRLNSLLLDTDELSPETIIDNATQQVVPRRGAIVKASFPSRQVMRMVLTLQQADGRPLPFGTQISDAQGNVLAVVGQAGQALVASDVPGLQQLHARWADQATRECQVTVNPGEIPQVNGYRLKTLTCQPRHAPSSTQTDMNHQEHTS